MAKRVVLAYSGGLDTSVAVRWMIDNLGVEVVALAVNVGQDGGSIDARMLGSLGPNHSPKSIIEGLAIQYKRIGFSNQEWPL